jgi:protein subunit release factor B
MFTVLHHCHSFLRAIKQMPPRPSITEAEISEAFLKGSGPGGQKIVRILLLPFDKPSS